MQQYLWLGIVPSLLHTWVTSVQHCRPVWRRRCYWSASVELRSGRCRQPHAPLSFNSQHSKHAAQLRVCVQPRTAAVNVTLLTAAADRRAAVHHAVAVLLLLGAGRLSINISCPQGTQQQIRHMLLQQLIDGTDGRTPDHYIDPALHTMRAVSIILANCSGIDSKRPHCCCHLRNNFS